MLKKWWQFGPAKVLLVWLARREHLVQGLWPHWHHSIFRRSDNCDLYEKLGDPQFFWGKKIPNKSINIQQKRGNMVKWWILGLLERMMFWSQCIGWKLKGITNPPVWAFAACKLQDMLLESTHARIPNFCQLTPLSYLFHPFEYYLSCWSFFLKKKRNSWVIHIFDWTIWRVSI